jgi:Zn-dependent protease
VPESGFNDRVDKPSGGESTRTINGGRIRLSLQDHDAALYQPGTDVTYGALQPHSPKFTLRGWWLNAVLFLVTTLTTTAFGSVLSDCFLQGRPLNFDAVLDGYRRLGNFDHHLWAGLSFSVPLLAILLAHELGHFLECRRRRVDASLPYFLPSPSLFGTFGAFIRIRTPIYSREALFDIGIGGPLAGFVLILPLLVVGVALSRTTPLPAPEDSISFGTPLALWLVEKIFHPGVTPSLILLHPLAVAAWAGLFATAMNLLPIGQLDGGHIIYAVGGTTWHRRASLAFVLALVIAGFFYWPWWLWAGASFFFFRRHPLIFDNTPIKGRRISLCFVALLIFFLSATVVPFK